MDGCDLFLSRHFLSCVKKTPISSIKEAIVRATGNGLFCASFFWANIRKQPSFSPFPLTYLLTYIRLRIHSFKIFSVEMERVINKNVWVLGTSWAKLLISFKRIFFRKEWGISVIIFFFSTNPNIRTKNIQDKLS